jgi:acetyl-CoA acetyltransferase
MSAGRQRFSGRAAIVGVGSSAFSRDSGTTVTDLAATAVSEALADAGLAPADVDGILTYHENDSVGAWEIARALGVGALRWHNDITGGGSQCASILADAAMAIDNGLAARVVVVRALNGRSGTRMGQIATLPGDDARQFTLPFGLAGPPHRFALTCRIFLERAGLDEDDLAAVAIHARTRASLNPRALRREPITVADHHASRMIASPLRLLDCCQESDGACALVITATGDRATSRPAAAIHAVARVAGPGAGSLDTEEDLGAIFSAYIAQDLYANAGMTPGDVELAVLYDPYTFVVLAQLADLGFCAPGEAGDFVREARLPLNPHGGLLSEAHVHGLNGVVEAVRQLRGEAGPGQLGSPSVALCTGFGGTMGSAAVLTAA